LKSLSLAQTPVLIPTFQEIALVEFYSSLQELCPLCIEVLTLNVSDGREGLLKHCYIKPQTSLRVQMYGILLHAYQRAAVAGIGFGV
jgi:hypothetical protein